MVPSPRPIAFFAFANDRATTRRYLRNLPEEEKRLRAEIETAVAGETFAPPEFRSNASLKVVEEVFLKASNRNRIVIFHFGGHADGSTILLETAKGAPSEVHALGFARFLGTIKSLKLVFLNGCSTEPQVDELLKAGVPAVIATSRDIDDAVATEFASLFYKSLASGAELARAFEMAESLIRSGLGERPRKAYRSSYRFAEPLRRAYRYLLRRSPVKAEGGKEKERWPWGLYPASLEPQIKDWTPFRVRSAATAAWDPETRQNLPYLCDRTQQDTGLQIEVPKRRKEYPHRPLVVLIHGEHRQVFDRFVDRLRDLTLPVVLSREPVRCKGPVQFKYARSASPQDALGPMRQELAKALNCGGEFKEIVAAVAAFNSPLLIDVIVPLEGDGRILEAKPLVEWLTEVAGWPDLPDGQDLLFLLRFGYHEKTPELPVDTILENVADNAPLGLSVVNLKPPLGNVYEVDVRAWIEKYIERSSSVRDCLNESASKMFRKAPRLSEGDAPSLPMEDVAIRLRSSLDKCLQQGG